MTERKHDASASIGAREYHKKTGLTEDLRKAERIFQEKYLNRETGRICDEYVRIRSCPVCGTNDGTVSFIKNGFEHLLCSCGMLYVAAVLKDEKLNLVYADESFEEETHRSFRTEPRRSFIRAIYEDGLKLIKNAGISGGFLLDVGSSSGLFMELAIEEGFSAKGVEPSPYAVKVAKEYGLDVTEGYFGKGYVENGTVDMITMWDVLEHCSNPDEILLDSHNALKPDGSLFLQVPNGMGLAPRIMKQDCNMFTGFGHLNLFGPKTIEKILKKHNFIDIKMQTVISEVSVINNYLGYHDPYYGPSTERENILGLIGIDDIHAQLLGYKLQVVARKGA